VPGHDGAGEDGWLPSQEWQPTLKGAFLALADCLLFAAFLGSQLFLHGTKTIPGFNKYAFY